MLLHPVRLNIHFPNLLHLQLIPSLSIKPWWFQSDEGKVCFSVRYGSWTIDLAKGKPSVEVESGEALVKALETIKIVVEAGELDTQIEIASAKLRSGFGK